MQEAVTRAIDRGLPFEDAEDLLRWIQTVSWRIVLDSRKRDQRLSYELPELAAPEDTARAVEAHLRLSRLRELIRALSPADYDALVGDNAASSESSRKDAVRSAVRRHRVRARLLVLLDGVGVAVAWLAHRLPTRSSRRAALAAVVAPAVAVSIALAPEWQLHSESPGEHRHGARRPTARAVRPTAPVVVDGPASGAPKAEVLQIRQSPSVTPRPSVTVDHPGPTGPGAVVIREKQPDDPLLCVDFAVVGAHCVGAPVQVTD